MKMNQLRSPFLCVCAYFLLQLYKCSSGRTFPVDLKLTLRSVMDKSSNYVMFLLINVHCEEQLTSCRCFVARFNASSCPDCLSSLRLS